MTPVAGEIVADRFRLVRALGHGGMGEVWLAHDARLDAACAVKFLHASALGGPAARARFEREARAAAQLRSPNVVQILDHGDYLGEPYIAMEMLQGEDLATRLRRLERIDARDMLLIVAQIARALTRAHAAGLVHRDLKPANVFIVPDDEGELIKVLDFGVVKSVAIGAASPTCTGQLLGTPSYMSPEQATGAVEIDTRSDLWSLGVLTFQCLTGQLPFSGTDLGDLVMKILVDPIPMPSAVVPSLGRAVDAWVERALTRDPESRFQTARELSEALVEAVTGAVGTGPEQPNPYEATTAASLPERPILGERYELLALLGAGGMGNVYKARDIELDELVALKVLRPEIVGAPGGLERFRREVKLARRVTHPNVARVFDIGEHGGDKMLTMELVDGEPLSALLERTGALPVARVVEIARAIAAGVGAAHAVGVVHRDLKPDNVMMANDGRVVVTDFGIARAAGGGASRTKGLVGTPAYMAPEQLEEGVEVDERADIYAFGAMLYELVTGERPWQGDSMFAIAAARLLRPPPDPRAKRPDLPASFAVLVLRCMARHPRDRHPSMSAVSDALAATTMPGTVSAPVQLRAHSDEGLTERAGKRVAVLPFENAGSPEQKYVADGLTEDLIDLLSTARGLRVTSRGVVMRLKASERDPREVGRELGVQMVVEGSVRRTARGFRITARLIGVGDGVQLWSKRFEASEAELLAKNEEIGRAVAEALAVEVPLQECKAPADAEAVDLYLRAREAANRGVFEVDPTPLFEQALARLPDDPRLLAGYAGSCARGFSDPATVQAAKRAAERAVSLAPSLPDGHAALGLLLYFHDGDAAAAVGPLRRALRLAPNHADAHDTIGKILVEAGRDEGRRHLEQAVVLDPGNEAHRLWLSMAYGLAGEREKALEHLVDPGDQRSRILWPAWSRFALWWRDKALAEELLREFPSSSVGPMPSARAILELLVSGTAPYAAFPPPPVIAQMAHHIRTAHHQIEIEIACFLGDHERALAVIGRADADEHRAIGWFDGCPLLAELHKEPAFAPMRTRAGERADRVIARYLTDLT